MAKYCLKKPSKRVACARRYKIQKKVREHNKKLKKQAKKNALAKRHSRRKPTSVPNKCPFKEEILAEAEQQREAIKEAKLKQKEATKLRKKMGKLNVGEKRKLAAGSADLKALIENAAKQAVQTDVDAADGDSEEKMSPLSDKSLKAYAAEVRRTIETADIILEVLDARDPLGSRCLSAEESALSAGKRLVLLLNKIDLVPKDVVKKWLDYLRVQFPTIAFKASTQEQPQKLGRWGSSNLNANSSKCVGADILMKLLGNYCRIKDIKTSVTVGVIGYPNVGKSSVINSLKRKKACNVGALPGITKESQVVVLGKNIRLIDSPGVVLAPKSQLDPVECALKNALRIDGLDPVLPVQAILRRCSRDDLILHYEIPDFDSCDEFLALIARKIGRMRKGGRPDLPAAAKKVLHDWNSGKLRYHTLPPETQALDEALCSAELRETFSKEFDIDALFEEQTVLVEGLPPKSARRVPIKYDPGVALEESAGMPEGMEVDNLEEVVVVPNPSKKKVRFEAVVGEDSLLTSLENDGNSQLNKAIKLAVKRQKRKDKKLHQRTERITDRMVTTTLDDEKDGYDFAVVEV